MRIFPLFLALLSFTTPQIELQSPNIPEEIIPLEAFVPSSDDIYLQKLSQCESGGNWEALNPIDLDGTPSKGKYQFKDTTFSLFSKKYGITTTSIWNGDEQELIVRKMIHDPSVDLTKQFPDCVRKIGFPQST